MKRKKIAITFTGFLIAALLAGGLVVGLLIWEHAPPRITCEIEGDHAFERGDYTDALQYWLKAKARPGQPSRLYAKMGTVYLKLSNLERAETCFKKALEYNAKDADTQQQLIRIALVRGDISTAEHLLTKRYIGSDADPNLLMLSGDLAMLQSKFKTAESAYKTAAGILPDRIRPKLKLAICFQEQKKTVEAEKLVTSCRTQGIKIPMDIMLAADYYVLSGNDTRAEKYFLMAVNSDSGNLEFKTRLCLFYRLTGRIKQAVAYMEELSIEHPENTRFKMMLVDFYLTVEKMADAEKLLKELTQTNKNVSGYNSLMGKFWLFKGRYSHAVSYLKAALDKNYGLVSAHYLLGVAYFAGGQGKLAEKAFIHALMLDPDNRESIFAMAALHYERGDYALADQYADRFLSIDSSSARAWKLKGLCALNLKNSSGAIESLSKSWHLGGGASALFFLGQAFEVQGMVNEARAAYSQVLEYMPVMYPALYAYARLASNQKQVQRALKKIDELENYNINPAIYYAGAKICLDLRDYTRCQTYINNAIAEKKTPGPFFILQAELFKKTGQDSGVEKILNECTTTQPQFIEGWLQLSAHYVKKQRIADAAQVLERALKYFPDHPEIKGNLAWLLLEQKKDFDRALDLARTAYDKMPGEAWLMDTLGWAYYHKQIYSQAEWMLAQAEESAPQNGMIQYHQGIVLYRRGKLSQAKTKLESALGSLALDSQQRNEAESLLAGLEGKKSPKDIGETMMFNPETILSPDLDVEIPMATDDSEDILKPDWSKMGSF